MFLSKEWFTAWELAAEIHGALSTLQNSDRKQPCHAPLPTKKVACKARSKKPVKK